jgi:hypothetical protein
MIAELGTDPAVVAAARQVVQAEKNFNPFAASVPSVCADATLPATPELRGAKRRQRRVAGRPARRRRAERGRPAGRAGV